MNSLYAKSYSTYSQLSSSLLLTSFINAWGWAVMLSTLRSNIEQYPRNMLTQILWWRGLGFSNESQVTKRASTHWLSSYSHLPCIIHNVLAWFAFYNCTFLLSHPHCYNFILPQNKFKPQNIMRPQIMMLCVVLIDRWLSSHHYKWLGEVWHWPLSLL